MDIFTEIKNKIMQSNKILLTAHKNPDGDAIGSGLALYIALKNLFIENSLNKEVRFILQDPTPYYSKFLKKIEDIEIYDENNNYDFDLVVYLDSANIDRVGKVNKITEDLFKINIDHHISNTKFGDINCVFDISSASEIIYNFLNFFDLEITNEIGEALYLGLVNDTGNFAHNNVTKNTLEMAANLVDLGVDNSKIVRNFLNNKKMPALKVLGDALVNFKFYSEKSLVYYFLDKKTMDLYSVAPDDCEGLVEKILSLDEASISLFLREIGDGLIKGSMRSKYDADVNKLANIFDGGGHYKAAGFSSSLKAEEILKIIMDKI